MIDLDDRADARNQPGGLDPAARHADIEQEDVGQLLLRDPDGVLGRSTFADHVQDPRGAAQGVNHALPKQGMIVDDRYAKAIAHLPPNLGWRRCQPP